MNDLLTAAKAVIDLYDYTGPADECEAANRLIAAVERAERQEAVGVDGYLKKVQQNWGDVEVKPDHRALWTAAQQAERERCREIVITMGGPDVPELLRQIDSGEE